MHEYYPSLGTLVPIACHLEIAYKGILEFSYCILRYASRSTYTVSNLNIYQETGKRIGLFLSANKITSKILYYFLF